MKNPFSGISDLSKMLSAARDMQSRMADMQKSLDDVTVTGESGAGLVKATSNAKGELISLDIDPSILVASEKPVVEDLIVAAIQDAQRRAQDRARAEMEKMAQSMGLSPDMMPKV